jgi:hypothetical protein
MLFTIMLMSHTYSGFEIYISFYNNNNSKIVVFWSSLECFIVDVTYNIDVLHWHILSCYNYYCILLLLISLIKCDNSHAPYVLMMFNGNAFICLPYFNRTKYLLYCLIAMISYVFTIFFPQPYIFDNV